jgi:hypothetical protein
MQNKIIRVQLPPPPKAIKVYEMTWMIKHVRQPGQLAVLWE